jgi:hypothetical protein
MTREAWPHAHRISQGVHRDGGRKGKREKQRSGSASHLEVNTVAEGEHLSVDLEVLRCELGPGTVPPQQVQLWKDLFELQLQSEEWARPKMSPP